MDGGVTLVLYFMIIKLSQLSMRLSLRMEELVSSHGGLKGKCAHVMFPDCSISNNNKKTISLTLR